MHPTRQHRPAGLFIFKSRITRDGIGLLLTESSGENESATVSLTINNIAMRRLAGSLNDCCEPTHLNFSCRGNRGWRFHNGKGIVVAEGDGFDLRGNQAASALPTMMANFFKLDA
jgi:hypothetical protein